MKTVKKIWNVLWEIFDALFPLLILVTAGLYILGGDSRIETGIGLAILFAGGAYVKLGAMERREKEVPVTHIRTTKEFWDEINRH